MDIRPIRTAEDHKAALRQIDGLWGAEIGTPDGDLLDILCDLVWVYEERTAPIPDMEPIDFLRAHMENTDRTQADLANLLGSRSRASEVLNRKRALTVEMIHKLSKEWRIPAEALITPYHLAA